jgi:hypothetical protein
MNSNLHNPKASDPVSVAVSGSISNSAEETLRLIASLPAPAGLEDRVHAALRSMPRSGRVLAWSRALDTQSDWMRTAAAAAIVFVVAGGGWGVYTHFEKGQQGQPIKVIAMPHSLQPGGFSGAGAMRTPQTLPGPTVILPVKQQPAPPKGTKKATGRMTHTDATQAQPAGASATAQ